MKKLLYALAGFGFMVSSCADDYLDTMPESSTATGTIVESVENAKMAINGICRCADFGDREPKGRGRV